MNSLADIMAVERIELHLQEKKKKKVIHELVKILEGEVSIDTSSLVKQILKREKMASTGVGHGVAIPHVLVEGLEKTFIVFGRSDGEVPFDAVDNRPVRLFFLLVGPKNASANHLKILSKLSRIVTEEECRQKLLETEDPREVIEIFRSAEEV